MSSIAAWFPTLIYAERLQASGLRAFNTSLLRECLQLREFDRAGRQWSVKRYPGGYTSYGSMDRLHRFSSTFDELRTKLDPHVRSFARAQGWDLQGRKLSMTDCWVNIMPTGCAHSFHLHPQSVVSGTYYVQTPRGCPGLKFEDPRLASMMAAPARRASAPAAQKAHISYPAKAGNLVLFESWVRHEVPTNLSAGERISVSFNYHW
ncbi:MAG TPA: TIGR02466 family protein [Solimonas sp.]|nr:TIGR02466 family protein [Solimonas sp.]